MFEPLPTPEEMAEWDRKTMEEIGIHAHVLMENAGREAFAVLREELGDVAGKRAVLFAGPGNNGGDAIALSRNLHEAGADTLLALTRPQSRYRASAGYNLKLAKSQGVPICGRQRFEPARPGVLGPFDIVVDGLLGTGFAGALRPDALEMVRSVNLLGKKAFVLALDIPSGLNGLTGLPSPTAVAADATVTFEAAKIGLISPEAAPFTGRLHVRRIGIPGVIKTKYPAAAAAVTRDILKTLPAPDPLMHKGRAGRVLVVGGSPGLTGAPLLAALAALRAGAGLVTAACPHGLEPQVKAGVPDVMTLPLGAPGETEWTPGMADEIKEKAPTVDAVVIGPGLGRAPGAGAFLERLLPFGVPAVIDADALFFLAEESNLRNQLADTDLLTPHPGEMAALLGCDIAGVQADRIRAATTLARARGVTAVLKGPATVVAQSSGEPFRALISPHACANLAVGGSGDALSGIIAALLAGGVFPLPAACLGVYWHGLAGKRLAARFPRRGNTASEIVEELGPALKEWIHA